MPPVTRRGYNNEFKHEVKSVSMPLQEHRISSIYPALRHRASARAKALYGAFSTREGRPPRRPPQCQHLSGLLSPFSFLRFPPRPPQCPHPNQLRVCAPPCGTFSLNRTDPQQPARRDFCHGATEPRSEVNVVPRHLRRTFVRVSPVPHPRLTFV